MERTTEHLLRYTYFQFPLIVAIIYIEIAFRKVRVQGFTHAVKISKAGIVVS